MRATDFISLSDAAKICETTRDSISRWVAEAGIPAERIRGVKGTSRAGLRRCLRERGLPVPQGLGNWPRILLVEDNDDLRIVLHCALSTLWPDVEIEPAEDGLKALGLLATFAPHLVVTDICLPGVDGLTLCRTIRDHPSLADTRILAITGLNDPHIRKAAFDEGAIEFIEKPLDPEEVRAAALRLLDHIPARGEGD